VHGASGQGSAVRSARARCRRELAGRAGGEQDGRMLPGGARGAILVDREITSLLGTALRPAAGARPIGPDQVQSSSVDLRLGPRAHRIAASFLPARTILHERLAELETAQLSLEPPGAVLERGGVYLVPLDEELELPRDLRASFNPRSSTGRCDLFARVLAPGHARFNEAPAGWRGPLWLEIAPLSFAVRLQQGDRLCQVRLERGEARLDARELLAEHERAPLVWSEGRPLEPAELQVDAEGGLALHLGLSGREPAGWRARVETPVLEFGRERAHEPRQFWDGVHAPNGHCVLAPGGFYLFASRERVRVPPHLAAEMVPVDVGLGEMRNNYAGFFDNGFGWRDEPSPGTPAVLEVRAHDVPFLVEDGQVFFRLRFFATSGRPERLYGEGRGSRSYQDQDLALARCFRDAAG
jgi:dCTP deaminase